MTDVRKVQMAEGRITEEMIREMRSKQGLKLRVEPSINNEDVTRIAIKKFAHGIGDGNPLWTDAEYAKTTRYGAIVAPPSWVISVFAGVQFGWPGLGGFHCATDMEFHRPVFLGDKIRPESTYLGFDGPKAGEFGETMVIDHYRNEYFNRTNELVTGAVWSVIRVERAKTREKGKYHEIQLPHPWAESELQKIEEQVLSERPTGSTIRYWEDVAVGDQVGPVVKGPLGLTDTIAYRIGGGITTAVSAHAVALRFYRRHPAWAFRDPVTHALEPINSVHYNEGAARAMGLPAPYDVGWQRQCWQIHLLTDWMGDEGWLRRISAEYRRFVFFSDVVWIRGTVVKRYLSDDGEHCVDIETSALNQREENVMPGSATVVLPSREKGSWPVARRLAGTRPGVS